MEQSEEDQDPVLLGCMNFLTKALKSLPEELQGRVKAEAGADVATAAAAAPVSSTSASKSTSKMTSTLTSTSAAAAAAPVVAGADGRRSSATATAVSAVTAAAGQLVGSMWRAGRGKGGVEREVRDEGGRGLVRELVERCLFSLPQERGHVTPRGDGDDEGEDGTVAKGGAGQSDREEEVGRSRRESCRVLSCC